MLAPRHTVPALLAALLLAGCGGAQQDSAGDFEGPQREVAEVIDRMRTAGQEEETGRMCVEVLSRRLVDERLGGERECPRRVRAALDRIDNYEVGVDAVRIQGDEAIARVTTGRDGDRTEEVRLVREQDGWRVAEFAGDVQAGS
jgi:hypothetical protein